MTRSGQDTRLVIGQGTADGIFLAVRRDSGATPASQNQTIPSRRNGFFLCRPLHRGPRKSSHFRWWSGTGRGSSGKPVLRLTTTDIEDPPRRVDRPAISAADRPRRGSFRRSDPGSPNRANAFARLDEKVGERGRGISFWNNGPPCRVPCHCRHHAHITGLLMMNTLNPARPRYWVAGRHFSWMLFRDQGPSAGDAMNEAPQGWGAIWGRRFAARRRP